MPSARILESALITYGRHIEPPITGERGTNGATALATALGIPVIPDNIHALSDLIGTSHPLDTADPLLNAALNFSKSLEVRSFRFRHGLDLDREQYPLYMEVSQWGMEGKNNDEPQIVRIVTDNYNTGTQVETFFLRVETQSDTGEKSITYKRYDASLKDINRDLDRQGLEQLKVDPYSTFRVQFDIPLPEEPSNIYTSAPTPQSQASPETPAAVANVDRPRGELLQYVEAMEEVLGLNRPPLPPTPPTRIIEHIPASADNLIPPAGAIMTLPDTALQFFPPTETIPAPKEAADKLTRTGYQPIFRVDIVSPDGNAQPYIAFCQDTETFLRNIGQAVTPDIAGSTTFTLRPNRVPTSANPNDIISLDLVTSTSRGNEKDTTVYREPHKAGDKPQIEQLNDHHETGILPPVILVPANRVDLPLDWQQTVKADAISLLTTTVVLDAMRAFSTRNAGVTPIDNTLVIYPGIAYRVLLQLTDFQSQVTKLDQLLNTPATEEGKMGPLMIYMMAFIFTALDIARRAKLGEWDTSSGGISLPPEGIVGGFDVFAIITLLRSMANARGNDRREHAQDELTDAASQLENILGPYIANLQSN